MNERWCFLDFRSGSDDLSEKSKNVCPRLSGAFYLALTEVVNFRGRVHPRVSTAPVGLWGQPNGLRLPFPVVEPWSSLTLVLRPGERGSFPSTELSCCLKRLDLTAGG